MNRKQLPLYCLLFLSTTASAQTDVDVPVNLQKYPDYARPTNPDPSLLTPGAGAAQKALRRGATIQQAKRAQAAAASEPLPSHVNNAANLYFPPVFNQSGGSCGSASRICYMFNYELNALRRADGSKRENQYPSHFTWLLTNSGSSKDAMAVATGVPSVAVYGGRTFSSLFGYQDCSDPDFGWMQGYDKWYQAMQNRITGTANFPVSVATEEGREAVKRWIYNHNGDTDFGAGGIVGIGVASGGNWQPIPASPANDEAGVTGKYFVKAWGSQVDHALTVVGYDDRIEFDLDGNGIVGEKAKDEVGAWIVVNSWGQGWCNGGFIYCPYKHAAPVTQADGSHSGYWMPEVYYARKNYRPLRTIKVKMDYSKRSQLCLSAGISANLDATEPDGSIVFEHFKYAGDGNNDGVDAETPMLGRWADGLHAEPMEFGYDLTDLSAAYDTRRPLKYFFIIDSKQNADGVGKVYDCSIIDYEFDKAGIELPFDLPTDGVEVKTEGGRTIISVIVPGEPINAPLNLVRDGLQLSWQAPAATPFALKHYNVYAKGELIGTSATPSYTVESDLLSYQVSAVYALPDGTTMESALTAATPLAYAPDALANRAMKFTNGGFTIPKAFAKALPKATIEFWIKSLGNANWNQQIGPNWGQFLFHANADGSISVGWDNGTGNRYNSGTGALSTSAWSHIAIVVDGNQLTLYKNGARLGQITSSSHSGLPKMLNFPVGRNGGGSSLNASIDEFRVWGEARTQEQIKASRQMQIEHPTAEPNLLAYYRMQGALYDALDGTQKLRDLSALAGDATILTGDPTEVMATGTIYKNRATVAAFAPAIDGGTYYVGQPIAFKNLSTVNAYKWQWEAPTSVEKTAASPSPSFTFNTPGRHAVTLTVQGQTTNADSIVSVTDTVDVVAVSKPEAAFTLSSSKISAGDRLMLTNRTTAPGCTYVWRMEGAEVGETYTTNAAATYNNAGTYTVTLTATNAAGSSSHSESIEVAKVAPKADFLVQPSTVVKGQSVVLEDLTKYNPEEWHWQLDATGATIKMDGQNSSFAPQHPGVYSATLTTKNAIGTDAATKKRALVVCNADSHSGLNFSTGTERVEFPSLVTDADKRYNFCVDFWMNPSPMQGDALEMGDTELTFQLRSNAKGQAVVYVRGIPMVSTAQYFIPSEWHHYAVSYTRGVVTLWRDGVEIENKRLVSTTTQYALPTMAKFGLSGDLAPMRCIIDELRVWNKAASAERIAQYANQPIADVAAAEADGLLLYADFNQSQGAVEDRTSRALRGVRTGFGPEGDAWASSLGVFSLSEQPADVTARYMTNYKAPFLTTGQALTPPSARFTQLEQGTEQSGWLLENSVKEGNVTTEFCVDSSNSDNFTLVTGQNGFADGVTNHKAFQSILLPAGRYVLTVTEGRNFSTNGTQLVAALGTSLPDAEAITAGTAAQLLAAAPLAEKALTFCVAEESTVSFGLLSNLQTLGTINISAFQLERSGYQYVIANGETSGIASASATGALSLKLSAGTLTLTAAESTPVAIHTLSGALLHRFTLNGTKQVKLAAGVYVVNGQKVLVP